MCRQIGLALGVSCLVAVLGTTTGLDAVHAFHHAWIFMAACSLTAGLILQGIPRKAAVRAGSVEVFAEKDRPLMDAAGEEPRLAPLRRAAYPVVGK